MSLSNRASETSPAESTGGKSSDADELAKLRERERQLMELMGTTSPDRILHDVRNLLNELTLLRAVLDDEKA